MEEKDKKRAFSFFLLISIFIPLNTKKSTVKFSLVKHKYLQTAILLFIWMNLVYNNEQFSRSITQQNYLDTN